MMTIWALWNTEDCAWLRLDRITGSRIGPTLESATLTWFDEDAAYAAIPQIEEMTGIRNMSVRSMGKEHAE